MQVPRNDMGSDRHVSTSMFNNHSDGTTLIGGHGTWKPDPTLLLSSINDIAARSRFTPMQRVNLDLKCVETRT